MHTSQKKEVQMASVYAWICAIRILHTNLETVLHFVSVLPDFCGNQPMCSDGFFYGDVLVYVCSVHGCLLFLFIYLFCFLFCLMCL